MTALETLPACRFEVGESFRKDLSFDVDSIRRFAQMLGDTNPLHHDEALARTTRFGGLIASGPHYSALMMGAVAEFLTQRGAALGLDFTFRFHKAVYAGSTMVLTWRIVEIEPKPSLRGHIVKLVGELVASDGAVAVSATSTGVVMLYDALLATG
jgi:acyl dehydratase